RQARALFLGGELQRLARALAALPDACLQGRPALALWQAWSQLCYRRFSACQATVAHLAAAPGAGQAQQQAQLCLLRFSLALQHDDLDAAQALLPAMQELGHAGDAVLQGGQRHLLAWYFSHLGLAEEARERLQGPAHYLDDGRLLLDSCFGQAMTPVMRGMSHLHEGQYRQAESCLRGALQQAEAMLGRHSEAAANAAGLLCEVLYEVDDHRGLRALLARYAGGIERLALPDAQLSAALAASRLHACQGALPQAQAALDALQEMARERDMPRIGAIVLHERLRLCLLANAAEAARAHLDALDALAQRALGHQALAGPRIAHWAQLAQARWHMHHLRDDAALELLHALQASPQLPGGLRVQACALAASVCQRSGQPHAALLCALQVLQQGQSMGLARSLLDLGPDYLQLARQVLRLHADGDPLLNLYAQRLLRQAGMPDPGAPAPAARAPALAALSGREQQVLQLLVHDLPNRRIAQALGVSTETVRWHLKNIFAKLAVVRRHEAIVAARGLGIQPGPAP
ncbi:MAG TPA: LuxR C-terminal-related transcriptional regulator, partial [Pseudorhodoferax sp.]|nr:LuxR C-terminal-related transcriptional regulator [Pseudorhodoferax sp.]